MEKNEKVYMKGRGKEAPFSSTGECINISLNVEDIVSKASGEWINLSVKKRKEADEWGNTHYIELNTYKPKGEATGAPSRGSFNSESEDNPFG